MSTMVIPPTVWGLVSQLSIAEQYKTKQYRNVIYHIVL
jgi:hypothetical protein